MGKVKVSLQFLPNMKTNILTEIFLLLEIINSWMINLQQNHMGFKDAGEHGLKREIWESGTTEMRKNREQENGLNELQKANNTVTNTAFFFIIRKSADKKT